MLPRPLRLPREALTDTRPLARTQSEHFSVLHGALPHHAGGAVIVSKKVAKLSVTRHLLKRRIKVIMAPHLTEGRTIVVHARPGAANLSFEEMEHELSPLLRSILA